MCGADPRTATHRRVWSHHPIRDSDHMPIAFGRGVRPFPVAVRACGIRRWSGVTISNRFSNSVISEAFRINVSGCVFPDYVRYGRRNNVKLNLIFPTTFRVSPGCRSAVQSRNLSCNPRGSRSSMILRLVQPRPKRKRAQPRRAVRGQAPGEETRPRRACPGPVTSCPNY